LGGNFLVSGLILSNLFLFLSLIFFFKLCRLDFNQEIARRALFLILIFPTSFFLAALYSDSLFLFLILSSFYFAREKRWLKASILAAFASTTKVFGVLLFVVFLFEYFCQKNFKLKLDKNLFWIFLSPLGFCFYLFYLKLATGNPWIFLESQGHWQRTLVFPWQTIISYGSFVFGANLFGTQSYSQIVLEFSIAIIFLVVLFFSYLKVRTTYIFYGFLYLFSTLATGNLLSQPRLVLAIFPFFLTLALWSANKILYAFVKLLSLLLLALFLALFLNGFWIA